MTRDEKIKALKDIKSKYKLNRAEKTIINDEIEFYESMQPMSRFEMDEYKKHHRVITPIPDTAIKEMIREVSKYKYNDTTPIHIDRDVIIDIVLGIMDKKLKECNVV